MSTESTKAEYIIRYEKARNGEFYGIIYHRNGNAILRSTETYKNRADVVQGMRNLLHGLRMGNYAHRTEETDE